jgi:AsmA protein
VARSAFLKHGGGARVEGALMKKVIIGIGILIVVVIAAAGIFLATFDVNSYHAQIQSTLQQQLNRSVKLGNMSLGLFPLEFKVQNIVIADDPKFGTAPFVQAKELDVSVHLLPLLHKDVEVDSINLQRPAVELIKNKDGVWNFASLGANKPKSQSPSSSGQFSLSKLTIEDGQVALTDNQAPSPRAVYDHIDFTLNDFASNSPFSLDLSARLPGAGSQEVRLQGNGGPIPTDPASTPFQGNLTLKNVQVAGLQKFLNSPALTGTDGVLSGETKISSTAGKAAAAGQMTLQNAKLHGIELGYPVTADYDVSDDLRNDIITINNTTLKLGSTPFNVNGTVNTKPTPAQIDLNLKANNVSIAELIQLAAASGQAFAPGMKVAGNVTANINAKGAADKPALSGSINGRNIQASGNGIALPVQVPAIDLALTPTDVRSNNFNVVSGGTTVNAQFALMQYLAKSPNVNFNLHAANAQLPAILSIAKAYGVTGLDNVSGQGTLNLDLRAAGQLATASSTEMAKALNGTMKIALNNVRYSGVDIDHEFAKIADFKNGSQADKGYTDISKVTGDVVIKSGVAQTSNLQAFLNLGTINCTGTANLADQGLNMRVTAVLTKQTAQNMGGVGGLMSTALADSSGQLVIPAIVTGTFQHPHYAPDLQQIAQMKLKGMSGMLGGLLGQKTGTATQGNQQNNPANQLMGLFGKKK